MQTTQSKPMMVRLSRKRGAPVLLVEQGWRHVEFRHTASKGPHLVTRGCNNGVCYELIKRYELWLKAKPEAVVDRLHRLSLLAGRLATIEALVSLMPEK